MGLKQSKAKDLPKSLTRKEISENEIENLNYYMTNLMLEAETNFPKLTFPPNEQSPYSFLPIPSDEEGYTVAFSIDQEEEIVFFYQKYGFVIIKDVLSAEDCEKSEIEVWEHIEDHYPSIDRTKPWTWQTENWPTHSNIGILGDYPFLSPQFCQNRQNPKAYKAFSLVLQTNKLRVGIERCGMMRPTLHVLNEDGTYSDRPEWKTSPFLHLDMYPWTGKATTYGYYVKGIQNINSYQGAGLVQGMMALKDCGPNDGGFCLIAGFQNHLKQWAIENEAKWYDSNYQISSFLIPPTDPLWKDIQNINYRRGSLCIFNNQLPHETRPNNSSSGRMIQYIKMINTEYSEFHPYLPRERIPIALTALGEKLYGFSEYSD